MNTEPPSQSNIPSEAERQKLLVEWNATEMALPGAEFIHELIERQVRNTPDAIALVCREKQLTYSELNARANRLAAHLRNLGVGPETLVGICVKRSLEMVIGLLGILKSGAAYVPLDPTYPKERLAFMLEDSRPLVLLTQATLLDLLPRTEANVLCLDGFYWTADVGGSEESNHKLSAKHHQSPLAYVIYTSGSTGKPKGVMVEHGNVLNFFTGMDARIPRGAVGPDCAAETWLAATSPSFDISVLELFWTLARGFKVVVYAQEEQESADFSVRALIESYRVTHLQCTPSMAGMLLLDEQTRKALGYLKTLLIGGEPFPVSLARQLREVFRGTILNMYGPTETTVWSTTWQLPADAAPVRIAVGRPIANTQIYILDSSLHLVPIGVEGELFIGGAGVARGYLGREQLTAERFIRSPFQSTLESQHSARLYRTGDLARYLPDGNVELLGRIDQQVKIRGHRVELGEIEAVLNDHPAVRESVVLFREIVGDQKILIAHVIPRAGQNPTREELRHYAKEKLPEHMVPAQVMFMTTFPQTPNRKIDRNAFPAPEVSGSPVRATSADLAPIPVTSGNPELRIYGAATGTKGNESPKESPRPATATENALSVLWRELLGLEHIGGEDNFFELGGHSMLAMQLVAKVRKRFSIDFRLKNIFERQTLNGMAEIIHAMSWSDFAKTPRIGEREVVDV